MIFGAIPEQPIEASRRSVRKGVAAIGGLSFLLCLLWYYELHIRHDAYFPAMWTPAFFVDIGYTGWGAFSPSTYPARLLEGSPKLKRLKWWRLGLILCAAGFLVAGLVHVTVTDAARFSDLFAIPGYLCVCVWITLIAYIKVRTSSHC